ncbi:MAG TPA: DUF1569 domain-containing protein [Phycisphaerales bacterium]|nr:DUF1569 domain-containing protein [Phycisphaerales bacterium]HMP37414.1 DUF1569 domain-containing protein [Phycisphaerales bacterium]
MIDTASVEGRRELRFDSLEAMLDDARACAAIERRGELRPLGNWTLGQALNHLAAWIEFPYVGYPPELVIPEPLQRAAQSARSRIMSEPMRAGERIGELPGGTLATEIVPTDAGLKRLESAAARLQAAHPPLPDPAFGRVTKEEWTQMNLRHAELHLGFFRSAAG